VRVHIVKSNNIKSNTTSNLNLNSNNIEFPLKDRWIEEHNGIWIQSQNVLLRYLERRRKGSK